MQNWSDMPYRERVAFRDKLDRRLKLADTYLKAAEDWMYLASGIEMPLSWWPLKDLAERAVNFAVAVVERLPDEFFEKTTEKSFFDGQPYTYSPTEDMIESVAKLAAVIDKRTQRGKMLRRIQALENTDGRTPEEADAYRRKAAALREGL